MLFAVWNVDLEEFGDTSAAAHPNTVVDQHGVMVTDGFSTEMGGPFGSYTFPGHDGRRRRASGPGRGLRLMTATTRTTLRAVDWSTASNIVDVPVAPRLPLAALSVWIVKGPFAQQRQKALNDARADGEHLRERAPGRLLQYRGSARCDDKQQSSDLFQFRLLADGSHAKGPTGPARSAHQCLLRGPGQR